MSANVTRTGGCLCGRVRYTAPRAPLAVAVCHCRDCQRQAGSALSILAVFPREAVRFEGEISRFDGRGSSGAPVWRHFCGGCGSPLYSDSPTMQARGIIAIKAGTLDEVDDLAPVTHYWVQSRQPWLPLPETAVPRARE